jgi:hypothetical protein
MLLKLLKLKHKNTNREWRSCQTTFLVSRMESRLERNKINEETQHNKNIRKLNKKTLEEEGRNQTLPHLYFVPWLRLSGLLSAGINLHL